MKKLRSAATLVRGQDKTRLTVIGLFILGFALIGMILLIRSFAANASVYLSPATSSVTVGNDVTVTLRMNPDTAISALDTTISYDATKLRFKSIDDTASAFDGKYIKNGTVPGKVNIVLGSTSAPVSSDAEMAKITFTAIGTVSGATTLSIIAEAGGAGTLVPVTTTNAIVNVTVPNTSVHTGAFVLEPTATAPVVGTKFGLKVYATATNTAFQGGEVTVNLPAGLSYNEPLDTTGTAFSPVTTVTGTTAQSVHLVFVTQSTTLTGKQLVATIPVTGSTAGSKAITMSGVKIAENSTIEIANVTAPQLDLTINAAALPAPIVTISGKPQIGATENITNLKQSFSITNYDTTATYTVSLGGTSIPVTNGSFSIPSSVKNGDHTMLIATTKNGGSGNASFVIRLRSPNVNRVGCVELNDLLVVNNSYGAASTDADLNFDGTVSLIDLLNVTTNWGSACI